MMENGKPLVDMLIRVRILLKLQLEKLKKRPVLMLVVYMK
jgi:hypothetical protein